MNRKEKRKSRERKEVEAVALSIFILRFLARYPLDQAKIWTETSRHITLHSERFDRRLVVWKLAVLIENRAISVMSFSQTLLSL